MYFDLSYYWRILRHVWSLRQWPGRRKTLARLLIGVPLEYLFHATCFLLDYLLFPRLWTQRVEQPVFIVGHARSGTTLAHRLMSADKGTFSYFLYWEMFFPSLLQKRVIRGLGYLDRRLFGSYCHRRLVAWDDKTFGPFRHMHDMSLWNAEEDQFVMRAACLSQQWTVDIPMMDRIDLFHIDQLSSRRRRRWLHHYRECVKRQLVLCGGNRIHLSKNPVMSGWVDALLEAFPDARFVVMMRNPGECIPSVLKLVQVGWKGRGWRHEDCAESLRVLTEISFDSYHLPRLALAARPMTPSLVVDYRELTTEPRLTVQAIYHSLGLAMSSEYDAFLLQQEAREKRHKVDFRYSLDEFEITGDRLQTELADFYMEYSWPPPGKPAKEEPEHERAER